jgi:hypothetical protein
MDTICGNMCQLPFQFNNNPFVKNNNKQRIKEGGKKKTGLKKSP